MTARPALQVEILDADPAAFELAQTWRETTNGWDVEVEVTALRAVSAAVRLSVALPSTDPHVLVPGAFYGENRPAGNDRTFPRFELGAGSAVDHEGLVSDEWHLRVDRAAAPLVMAWTGPGEGGLALATEEVGDLGEQSLGFAARGGLVSLSVTAPLREFPVRYLGDGTPHEPEVRHHAFAAGERGRLRARLYPIGSDRHDYDRLLRQLHTGVEPPEPWVDLPEAAAIAAEGLVRWHFDPDPGVLLETVGFDRGIGGNDGRPVDRQAMHVGWVSGIPWAYALLAHAARTGDGDAERAARAVIDFCCAELSPSGTFWGVWYRGRGWTQSWSPLPLGLHGRTLGEATDFLLRALELHEVPRWRAAARSNLDAIVERQRGDGNLGLVHHAETGEVLSWAGSASLAWVPALLRAREWDERYLPAAVRAGGFYARFVEEELLHGAPEDVGLAPTSEDGYVAVMAYMALHRVTGQKRWLDLARRAAEWTFTFRYTYDVTFGPRTPLGVYGFRTTGADQASSSNLHVHAYGLVCTEELLELSDRTGDDWYRRRALETLACFRQLLPVRDGDLNSYRGMIPERYYQTDCFQPKGMVLGLSHAWSAGVLLLGCEQAIARGLS